eukprot:gnl/MRDRNA2_/MRDRNA2_262270_c0_seq1.p1 gnl/MRDRNA2_/MRDRNA2_262270_c0~~gnl/MRDRNA2_/MRDRNA2_262270_c0_seq1.p1  ORF type:complete len:210 (-),score=36.29 gnl/MRDRNA2_/MRDRNA2_262270_c0_seq1:160-699(-)
MERAPEAEPLECNGCRFRRCAVGVVFNEKGEVLLGERIGVPGSWQMPQGGLNAGESAAEAGARELYEEVGLSSSQGLELVASLPESEECCYKVDGGWLKKAGYDGQVLLFSLFFFPGQQDPGSVCNLTGMGGEKPEFSAVRWAPLSEASNGVWAPKQPAYSYLVKLGTERIHEFLKSRI